MFAAIPELEFDQTANLAAAAVFLEVASLRAIVPATVCAHQHYLRLFEPEVDKDAPEIFVVFFNAMVELADMALIQEAQHSLL